MSVVYLFPGQGSQYVGMGRALYEREPAARAVFDQADAILGFSLSRLCFDGPEDALTDTVNQQPALVACSIVAWQLIESQDAWPRADYVAGHSLGEFSALVAAGSISFADGLRLVRKRGELMKRAGEIAPGGMAALLGLDADRAASICATAADKTGKPVQLANDNCPGQLVISGDVAALEEAMHHATTAGARKVVRLPISIAAHSELMAPVSAEFAAVVDSIPVNTPNIPIIGNVTATPLPSPRHIRQELKEQLTQSVRWTSSMQQLQTRGVTTFIEVGPGNVLTGLMKRIDRQSVRQTFDFGDEPG
ncbi:MAG: ACP S-malonyltransferase [Anaerolineae bacterium]|nr:ACP S-malonyltransferase [Anaerolineae bacterium]